jgi:hypothetical protein
MRENCCYRLKSLWITYVNEYYDVIVTIPSLSTVARTLKRNKFSRKVMERRNINQDDELREQYAMNTAYLHQDILVDIDEMASNPESFHEKYGWAPRGEDALKMQIRIGERSYSVIAAYTTAGFLVWEIHDVTNGGINEEVFQEFLFNRLQHVLSNDSFGLIDNATIHRTVDSRLMLENIFDGKYCFSPPYSPDLKPIELGFANIKRWLRSHENDALMRPIEMINNAFELYSILGERGHKGYGIFNFTSLITNNLIHLARNHFNFYRKGHRDFQIYN